MKRALAGDERKPEAAAVPQVEQASAPPLLRPDETAPPVVDPTEILRPAETPKPLPVADSPPEPARAAGGRPRLARGLASFSRSNSDREKKFAHLLHDDPSGEKKP